MPVDRPQPETDGWVTRKLMWLVERHPMIGIPAVLVGGLVICVAFPAGYNLLLELFHG